MVRSFPSHSTLLYLLYQLSIDDSPLNKNYLHKNTRCYDSTCLHDHLQGGIFRYCVDREWTIPHFEKMLYDQAMALWVYSLGYSVTRNSDYKRMAEGIIVVWKKVSKVTDYIFQPMMLIQTTKRAQHMCGAMMYSQRYLHLKSLKGFQIHIVFQNTATLR